MFKELIKFYLPNFIIKNFNSIFKRNIRITGSFKNWNKAILNSGTYNNKEIFINLKKSFLKIINNEACFERDSVTFNYEKLNKPLISLLEKIRKNKKKKFLRILDFGGSFGSTYFQNKKIFHDELKYQWDIIEQIKIVDFANKTLKIKNLNFYKSINHYIRNNNPDIVLFSSVLHYLEFPFQIIEKFFKKKIGYFIVLKTPFTKTSSQIRIQVNPQYIYKANYPIRIFNETLFKSFFKNKKYQVQNLNWDIQKIDDIKFKSFVFKKNK